MQGPTYLGNRVEELDAPVRYGQYDVRRRLGVSDGRRLLQLLDGLLG